MVFVSAILTFVMFLFSLAGIRDAAPGYILAISVILWFTVLFGNFAEAIAEGRGKAQADALRAGRKDTMASRIPSADRKSEAVRVKSTELKKGDLVYIKAGEQIPADGDVVEGAASVDESAITGESASGKAAVTEVPSQEAPRLYPTGSWCGSAAIRARASWIK